MGTATGGRRRRTAWVVAAVCLGLTAACTSGAPAGEESPAPTATASSPAAPTSAPAPSGPAAPAATPTPSTSPSPTGPARAQVAGTVTTGLTSPWGLAFLPDGSALVSERDTSRIKRIPAGGGTARTVGTVPGVVHGGEGGLLGIAVGPTFAQDRWVYAYFTGSGGNRVVRMQLPADLRLGAPQRLLTGIPSGPIHNGGRLAFGPDGMLYVSTGDASERSRSQDRGSLAGKILRLTPDGKPAPGNPFAGSPVWSYGHRNVQGMAWDADGTMWASEFGQNTWDELNRIEPGRNYGWPIVEGRAGRDGFVDPVVQWRPAQASPSGIAVAAGSVWLAALRGQRLWQVPLTGSGVGDPVELLRGDRGRLRTVALAPDGSLWLVTSNTDGRGSARRGDDRILRLTLTR